MSKTHVLTVMGKVSSPAFQRVRVALEHISTQNPKFTYEVDDFLPFDWEYLLESQLHQKSSSVNASTEVISQITATGQTIVGDEDLISYLQSNYDYTDIRPSALYTALGTTQFKKELEDTKHPFCFFDISIDGKPIGKLVIELYDDICPKTCKNFQTLCVGGTRGQSIADLSYRSNLIHRVVKGGWIQAGDICGSARGDSGESIYGPVFADENFIVKHDKAGIVGMANHGPHTNSSQFYITLKEAPWMNTKYVAFGRVVDGYSLLKQIESLETENQRPVNDVRIDNCGLLDLSQWTKSKSRR